MKNYFDILNVTKSLHTVLQKH